MKPSPILLATSNAGKVAEFRVLLGEHLRLLAPTDEEAKKRLASPPSVPENGTTYYENALVKALRYQEQYGFAVLADDSGVEVDALKGGPGVDSAILGGENLKWPERRAYLLSQVKSSGEPGPWTARFRCVLCFFDGLRPPSFYSGITEGHILESSMGTGGFGYDPLFWSKDLKKGFGEASEEEKNRVSHRARAVQVLLHSLSIDPEVSERYGFGSKAPR